MEAAAFNKERAARSHEQMMYTSSGSYWIYIRMVNWDEGSWGNSSYVDDPTAKKAKAEMLAAMAKGDQAKADAIYKEFEKYGMEQAWMIPFPRPYNYVV